MWFRGSTHSPFFQQSIQRLEHKLFFLHLSFPLLAPFDIGNRIQTFKFETVYISTTVPLCLSSKPVTSWHGVGLAAGQTDLRFHGLPACHDASHEILLAMVSACRCVHGDNANKHF
jgi:hypothetical protein